MIQVNAAFLPIEWRPPGTAPSEMLGALQNQQLLCSCVKICNSTMRGKLLVVTNKDFVPNAFAHLHNQQLAWLQCENQQLAPRDVGPKKVGKITISSSPSWFIDSGSINLSPNDVRHTAICWLSQRSPRPFVLWFKYSQTNIFSWFV